MPSSPSPFACPIPRLKIIPFSLRGSPARSGAHRPPAHLTGHGGTRAPRDTCGKPVPRKGFPQEGSPRKGPPVEEQGCSICRKSLSRTVAIEQMFGYNSPERCFFCIENVEKGRKNHANSVRRKIPRVHRPDGKLRAVDPRHHSRDAQRNGPAYPAHASGVGLSCRTAKP